MGLLRAVEKWHPYLHGNQFTALVDHKPLLSMRKTTKAKLKRWRLRLAPLLFRHPVEERNDTCGTRRAVQRPKVRSTGVDFLKFDINL